MKHTYENRTLDPAFLGSKADHREAVARRSASNQRSSLLLRVSVVLATVFICWLLIDNRDAVDSFFKQDIPAFVVWLYNNTLAYLKWSW